MTSHAHGMMKTAPTDMDGHESHMTACAMGHCAVFCGVLIPSFSVSVSVAISFVDTRHQHTSRLLTSALSLSDPPPPKF
ncbi:MAG: hypothetical protein P8Q48_23250 [Paracoccaceae bacterium]|nr:hypothetical protein [Paracoccaceae bacterium]